MPMASQQVFWNRESELGEIKKQLGCAGFGYVTGRRRVGKTALLKRFCGLFGGFYHQAVEGTPEQQLLHLAEELSGRLSVFKDIRPRTWEEFFRILDREKLPPLIVFDEFPYWIQGDTHFPSVFQKWIDHSLPQTKTLVLVSGSSQTMLHSSLLSQEAPLYGRAKMHLSLQPMNYQWFCKALGYRVQDPVSFNRFSLTGGIPHYWKLLPQGTLEAQAEALYFQPSGILAEEPTHWLRDEGVTGTLPKAMLDLIGRGVTKPSELASRLAVPQGNLSRPLSLLLELGLAVREVPFGESIRSSKRVCYRIYDSALSFYYGSYLPQRAFWPTMKSSARLELIQKHASVQWENECRNRYPGSSRYWEGDVEIDFIAPLEGREHYLIAECKWKQLAVRDEARLLKELEEKFRTTQFFKKLKKETKLTFQILSQKDLNRPLKLR